VAVIGHGMALKVMTKLGLRPIAMQLDVPHTTVRTWWHRFRARSPTIRAYREQGLSGLKPEPRSDLGTVRRHPELLDEACALRAALPTRSAGQIAAILFAPPPHPCRRTHDQSAPASAVCSDLLWLVSRARSAASRPRAPTSCGSATCWWVRSSRIRAPAPAVARIFFVLLDDYSRLILHGRWVADQNRRAGQDVLRAAIQRRGVPERLYVDNGAPYSNAALERSCAVLGIRLIHSRPYTPEGRGKLERVNRFIRERFLSEAEAHGITSFAELNDRFLALAEQICNTREHAETHQAPIDRFSSHGPLQPVEPSLLREAFRWSLLRRVTSTASVSLAGNRIRSIRRSPVDASSCVSIRRI
jgi:putative transposase